MAARPNAPATPTETLTEIVLGPHAALRQYVDEARSAAPDRGDPRRPFALCDRALAALSAHLAAVEEVVYPWARRKLPDGRQRTAHQLQSARHMERVMRGIQGAYYGDHFALATPRAQLWEELRSLLDDHVDAEGRLVEDLARAVTEDEQAALVERFRHTVAGGPTRPHPYSPHSRFAGRYANRLWSFADHAMDVMDARMVPARFTGPRRPADTPWGQYVLGQPLFDEEESSPRE